MKYKDMNAIDIVRLMLTDGVITQEQAAKYFPGLTESKNEKIRKALIILLHRFCKGYRVSGFELPVSYKDMLGWVVEQGEQKSNNEFTFKALPRLLDMIEPTDKAKAYCQKLIESLENEGYSVDAKIVGECLKCMNGEKVSMATMDEQKPTIQPKFHEGDWVINTITKKVEQVIKITNGEYICSGYLVVSFNNQHLLEKWTIQDAKDGDVLAVDNIIFIYERTLASHIVSYCKLINDVFESSLDARTCCEGNTYVHPATKEQRDMLKKAMTDAGYKWNASEKKLEKIEQKPAEWSEEDEKNFARVDYACLKVYGGDSYSSDWLRKFLGIHKKWKPSKEQIKTLEYYMTVLTCNEHKEILFGLLEQIKNL